MKHKDRYIDIRNTGVRISLLATFAIIVVFAFYGRIISPTNLGIISSNVGQSISNLGLSVFLFLCGSLFAIGYGVYLICLSEKMKVQLIDTKIERSDNDDDITMFLPIVVDIISQTKRYQLVFVTVLIAYALLFAFISQIIIFRPDVSFSHIYQVAIPSWIITPCCNLPGLVPTFTAYLSDSLIVYIIPINLVLTVVLSTLVSVNITLALYVFQKKNSNGNNRIRNEEKGKSCFSGIGAAAGLFTACPTCAGTFFSTIVGVIAGTSSVLATASTGGAVAVLAPFQGLFIGTSIVILLASPYLTIKGIKKSYLYDDTVI
jgi:hypothetical protein